MFTLYQLETTIAMEARALCGNFREQLTLALENQFIGKLFKTYGVSIAIHTFSILENFIKGSEVHVRVDLGLVIFKPFIDEILVGTIKNCNQEGILVDLEFFEAILPAINLAEAST